LRQRAARKKPIRSYRSVFGESRERRERSRESEIGRGRKSFDEDPIKITSSQETSAEGDITREAKEGETKSETRSRDYIKGSFSSGGKGRRRVYTKRH